MASASSRMHHKNVLLVARTTRNHDHMRKLASTLDVSILLSTPDTFEQAISSGHDFDLVVLDMAGISQETLNDIDAYVVDKGLIPTLFIVDEDQIPDLHLPVQGHDDFVVSTAGLAELELRMTRLLWPDDESAPSDIVTVDNMTINLATYQVYIDDEPVDLTLMEYSLLSFLATHPSRAYSREALLHRVWGFEYCGGTRTVDVHIRRVRSKVGPQVASHITTVRGVGYLFKL
jgi:DNA-binding response OmpR family regulator